jgi:O-antigen/teichoic acid export membrane protein
MRTDLLGKSFQRFLRNFAAQSFGQVVNIASQIFSVPLFLYCWNKTSYGEWVVLTTIPSLLWTLDNGLAGLAGSRMTIITGRGGDENWEEANRIFHNVLLVQTLLGLLIFAAVAVIVSMTDVSAAFGFHHMTRHEAGTVLLLMIGYMLLGFGIGLIRAGYRASLLEHRGVALACVWKLSDFLTTMLVLCLGGQAIDLACGLVVSIAFWVVFMFIDVRRRCPRVDFAFGPISGSHLRSTVVDGLPILAGEAAFAFFLQGYPLVVNRLLGPAAVVTLTTLRTASRALYQGVMVVGSASSSEFSRTYGNNDKDGFLRLLKVLLAATLWAGAGICIGLTIFGPWVIAKWTNGKVIVGHEILFLFGLSVAFQGAWSASRTVLTAMNLHHRFNYVYLGLTLTGLASIALFEHQFGFIGIPLNMVIVDGVILLWALLLCRQQMVFVPFHSLGVIFQPSFYLRKLLSLKKRTV